MNRTLTFVVLAGCLFAGCSSLPPAPVSVDVPDYRYVIGPGDKLEINVWRHPEVSAKIEVGPDGKASAPLIDEFLASGKEPVVLAREIQKRLATFIVDPAVSVLVTEFIGNPDTQVRIVGEATKPAAIAYKRGMTLLDAMIQVGGLTEFASGNRSVLIRQTASGGQYSLRIADLLRRGDVSANVQLLPGDVIMIPEGPF